MRYVIYERPLGTMIEVGIDSVKRDPRLGFPLTATPTPLIELGVQDPRLSWCYSGLPKTDIVAKTGFDKNFDGTS